MSRSDGGGQRIIVDSEWWLVAKGTRKESTPGASRHPRRRGTVHVRYNYYWFAAWCFNEKMMDRVK
ncbi:MAG: hypothetical protein WAW31_12440 [Smithella sp.]